MDPAHTAVNTRVDKLPSVLDFASRARWSTVAGTSRPSELAKLFRADALYEGGAQGALSCRPSSAITTPAASRCSSGSACPRPMTDEQLDRVMLGHAMLLTLRGVPTIYYGDEQGFVGDGGDQDAREDMFPSKVASLQRQ
jgi:hypothetical protein